MCLLAMSLNALHLENYRETHEADTTNWQDNEAEDTLTRRILAKATTSIRRHRWHEAEDHLRDDIEYIKTTSPEETERYVYNRLNSQIRVIIIDCDDLSRAHSENSRLDQLLQLSC